MPITIPGSLDFQKIARLKRTFSILTSTYWVSILKLLALRAATLLVLLVLVLVTQLTAAKKFLQMVRDGLKKDNGDPSSSRNNGDMGSIIISPHKASEEPTDDEIVSAKPPPPPPPPPYQSSVCNNGDMGSIIISPHKGSEEEPTDDDENLKPPPSPPDSSSACNNGDSDMGGIIISPQNGCEEPTEDENNTKPPPPPPPLPPPPILSSNGINNNNILTSIKERPTPPNGVTDTGSGIRTLVSTAMVLAEDFNGQLTAAEKFLQMVRDGLKKDDNGDPSPSRNNGDLGGIIISPHKGSEEHTDDESAKQSPSPPPPILSSNNNINNNNILTNIKERPTPPNGVTNSGSSIRTPGKGVKPLPATAALAPPSAIINHPILEKGPPPSCVQEVWAHNLLEEFSKIRKIVKQYTFIAMDTEFPGIVVRPQCTVRAGGVFPYELLKQNVDRLKIIQLGVTFMDKDGKMPPDVCTWQFNFKFSLNTDMYAPDSISLLTRCGIQFEKHAEMGIDPECFGEYFMSSGMVTSDQVTYLTFHSGFDFGYLIKLLSNLPLPENEEKFFEIMKIYFPNVYDLKFLMKSVDMHGGLQDIANQLGQARVGIQHQAGSDSLLTGMTFFKLLQTDVFKGEIDESKYCGKLYGFHMSAEDGRDEGWSEIPGDLIDPTSPKPLPSVSKLPIV